MADGNLFDDAPAPPGGESFTELLRLRDVVIERIVSSADVPPTRYCQSQDEWVVLLKGEATIEVAGVEHRLVAGDHLFIAAGVAHVVRSTSDGATWLAVHVHPPA